jgi:hypothetical protein
MTFEEFLIKKKIDLAQFNTAEPGLFLEFKSHYSQMGEKSFDHSKKFLFNKLRRAYHLKEEPKAVVAKETIEVNEIASQAEPLLSPTVEATVYTPRFRAGGTAKPAQPAQPEPAKSEKPAYTPRFKAPTPIREASQPNLPASDLRPQTSDLNSQPVPESPGGEKDTPATGQPKPAFKPRFKPGITSTQQAKPVEENKVENAADKPKPAYVPRFKAQATIKEAPQPDQPTSDLRPQTSDLNSQAVPENTPDPESTEEKKEQNPATKPAYIPRFKASARPKPAEEKKDEDSTD